MNSASSYTVSPSPYSGRKRAWTSRELASNYHSRHEPGMHVTETTTEPQFPPIKRVANERERTRTASVNDAFLMLRSLIPTEPMNRKLSKIETLRLASSYISHLHAVLVTGNDPADQPCLRHQQLPPSGCALGRCPITRTDQQQQQQRMSNGKDQHRPVCTFCVTEMKQHQRVMAELANELLPVSSSCQ
ncbi:hypothetical protein AHF37_11882 [Paragonimus kellicotti]|nr:hypothetical protein AHF37_11882 [Paragonimus kellicotti]